jgi:hypothetical protein
MRLNNEDTTMDFDFSPVDSVDKVPAQFKPLYSQQAGQDGKFTVDPNFAPIAEAINGFNKSNKTLREQLKTVKPTDLSPLAEYGDSPESIAAAVQAKIAEASGTKGVEVAKQVDAAKAAIVEANRKELEKRDTRNQALQTQLYGLIVDNAATAAVAELKGVPELLLPFIKQQVKVVEQDGAFHAHVIDGKGEVRYGVTGSPMTIKELVVEMKAQEKYGRLFESETPPGGGFRPGGGTQPRQPTQEAKSATSKIAAGLDARTRRR